MSLKYPQQQKSKKVKVIQCSRSRENCTAIFTEVAGADKIAGTILNGSLCLIIISAGKRKIACITSTFNRYLSYLQTLLTTHILHLLRMFSYLHLQEENCLRVILFCFSHLKYLQVKFQSL